ncbi:HlyD family efflux transporter periplasmic adaptor subunit [Synechococcus sp. CCY9202]|uniref:HlyD family efflux transporter periplasmic adaptor subunit n=1 Tax=Synechococcus sp. CCY9202 TaxID=174698 RepID=UPI002B1F9F6B|nr:HlyD family efflux transporter periplasmic adaptor subunit [Synechococcus sp. CCY9202]MEA5423975.1 HlyD family efflux transporter periplasmic adaptor subunit [Synechococcus sp. CCY9202]
MPSPNRPPRSGSAPDPSDRLLRWLESSLAWLRSPRSARRSAGRSSGFPPDRDAVIPVRVDLVGVSDPTPPALAAPGSSSPPSQGLAAEEAQQQEPSHPFGQGLVASRGGTAQPREWSFAQPVLLNKTRRTSSLLVWTAVGGITAVAVWAMVAPIAETIAVQGKLEPSSTVKEVKSPVDGQVELVLVKEGQSVRQGDPLVRFDLRQARSRLAAAESIRQRLLNENSVARATLGEEAARGGLTPNQLRQLNDRSLELQSRLDSARQDLRKSETRLAGYRESLATYTTIAERYEQLVSTGAVSELQLLEARNKAQEFRSKVAEEEEEISRLRSQLVNTGSGTDVELRTSIEANLRQISELEGQIREARLQIQYGTLKAPSNGTVFDLNVGRGSVVVAADPKAILKVVPQDNLQARVYLPNRSIGFVRVGQKAEISIDTFPASEYGYLQAEVQRIGSDALTPEQQAEVLGTKAEGLYFPAVLRLKRQNLPLPSSVVPLKAGMSLTADLQLRERRVISLLTGLLEDQRRNLERLRAR